MDRYKNKHVNFTLTHYAYDFHSQPAKLPALGLPSISVLLKLAPEMMEYLQTSTRSYLKRSAKGSDVFFCGYKKVLLRLMLFYERF